VRQAPEKEPATLQRRELFNSVQGLRGADKDNKNLEGRKKRVLYDNGEILGRPGTLQDQELKTVNKTKGIEMVGKRERGDWQIPGHTNGTEMSLLGQRMVEVLSQSQLDLTKGSSPRKGN